jgi:cobyrinic acid a,c-diamide synthase
MKSIIIAAPQSGSGKTTVTLGIMESMRRRGLTVAPFKVGPDFIDPGYHRLVTGQPSLNLDGWMCQPEAVRDIFMQHSHGADIAVIEGVMGLFDGIDGVHEEGSTAQVAKIIGAPVILVVDARSQARSAAALVKGFATYDPAVRISGVIFNNVGSEAHARILRDAVEGLGMGIPVIGCIPREEQLRIPSRHLGLFTVDELPLSDEYLDYLVAMVRAYIDFGLIWAAGMPLASGDTLPLQLNTTPPPPITRIAVARDMAFCFVYETNLTLLREAGAEIVEFSPLRDADLPEGINGIYLPGGYPELFAEQLAANGAMLAAIRAAINAGMPVYAECGGFIYLTKGVMDPVNGTGNRHDLVGTFPALTQMLPRRRALGYREVAFTAPTILGPAGTVARGHEFHYSEMTPMTSKVRRAYQVRKHGVNLGTEGFRYKNCLASYIHLHFGSNPALATNFVASCRKHTRK